MEYTNEQRDIFNFVKNGSGNGIIDAVAGAGKTTTIIECARVTDPKNSLLYCAFNNSIAREIEKKVKKNGIGNVVVKTIHALGYNILKQLGGPDGKIKVDDNKYKNLIQTSEKAEEFQEICLDLLRCYGYDKFTKHNDEDGTLARNHLNAIYGIIQDIVFKFRVTLTQHDVSKFDEMLEHYGLLSGKLYDEVFHDRLVQRYYEATLFLLNHGEDISKKTLMIDFADMLYLPVRWNLRPLERFDYLFIDECQDLSKAQLTIALMHGKSNGRILAVGDPRQSIYGFNGADIKSFQRIRQTIRPAELKLTQSFRCPMRVIEIAQTIRPDITGSKTEGGIVGRVKNDELIDLSKPGDMVISRFRKPLLGLLFDYIDRDIKVKVHEDEVKNLIGELKMLFKQRELVADVENSLGGFEHLKADVIKRGNYFIERDARKIKDDKERTLYIQSERSYLKKRIEFLHRKYEKWKMDCPAVTNLLERLMKYMQWEDNPILLATIHRAKGLENKRVFILDYDILPYKRIGMQDWELTQEENLKYVAVTRSLAELYQVESEKMIDLSEDEGSLLDLYPIVD